MDQAKTETETETETETDRGKIIMEHLGKLKKQFLHTLKICLSIFQDFPL
jgi:hypothetical protein